MNWALSVTCNQGGPTGIQSPSCLHISQLPLAGRNSAPELLLPASCSVTDLARRKAIFPFFGAYIYVVSSPTVLTHRCSSLNFPVFSHTVIPPPSPSSSGTGEHYLYLQPVACLADPYPTQTFLLLCPALVHLSALPPLLLTPRFCFWDFFSILSLTCWKLCASCRVPDIYTLILPVLQNLC